MTEQIPWTAAEPLPVGDLGRRLALRRTRLGLSREETAARAGMAPSYLRFLEEQPVAAPGIGALMRLAGALQTTVTELTGGDAERPPGPGRAARHAEFSELTADQCRALFSSHGVGHLAVPTATGPVVVPVNYTVVDGAIVFRTAPGATPALAAGCQVAFEVDRVDDAFSSGWSVLVRGYAKAVTDLAEVRRLDERAYSAPWAGGPRTLWIRIEPRVLSGRRITV
ncbi:helix-turn-helix domain-containing protein [Streptomyces cupreus]|uniref:Pyridoxamine 5'-phosphate oxidase family protein n=1 Tax=Streptomyces cupreus TaxID=2759956 RepID=A0A7X1MAY0_9ACTN|nr:pyridoxamine 5'-phosphate oxidase family protein [Streptomyces cupreus]MBC2904178.1 pyridoxamine 5'-phosphate oxidase family protein [Streptomyces cupreus]